MPLAGSLKYLDCAVSHTECEETRFNEWHVRAILFSDRGVWTPLALDRKRANLHGSLCLGGATFGAYPLELALMVYNRFAAMSSS
jgi:hypothetical protein